MFTLWALSYCFSSKVYHVAQRNFPRTHPMSVNQRSIRAWVYSAHTVHVLVFI